MNAKQKMQAFTLSEMVVVIILSSIVVGMAFTVLSLVQNHMQVIKQNFSKNTEINKLEQALCLDFNRYNSITYLASSGKLQLTTEIDTTMYQFTDTYSIKNSDTFKIACQQKTYYLDGNEVQNGHIDGLKLELSKSLQNQTLFIYKQNDATIYLNKQESISVTDRK